jgi:hypothetical protein
VKRLPIALVLLLAACSADLTLPPKADLTVPPSPENLEVTSGDYITYHLEWDISDPTVIDSCFVYVLVSQTTVARIDTVAVTGVRLSGDYTTDPPVPVPGIVFGVSAVSNGIESYIVYGQAE